MARISYKRRSSRKIQRSRNNSNQDHHSGGNGNLDNDSRVFMENRFKSSFGNVTINNDTKSSKAAAGLGARAFTIGENIYFSKGEYNPKTIQGKRLLAHELTHVIQQRSGNRRIQTEARDKNNTNQISSKNDLEGTEDSVVNKSIKRYERIIRFAESVFSIADNVLASKDFSEEKLARIRTQANKLKPVLDELKKAERGMPMNSDLYVDFDPKRDWIDEEQAGLSADDIANDFEINDEGKKVQKGVGFGLTLFVIGLSLLLKGCKKKPKKVYKKKYGNLLSRSVIVGPKRMSGCGAKMKIQWVLDKKVKQARMNGYIIQEVHYDYNVKHNSADKTRLKQYSISIFGKKLTYNTIETYYEAWPVRNGYISSGGTDTFKIPCINWVGNLKKEGWAKFIPNTSEPASWGTIYRLAGGLLATRVKPKFWNRNNTLYRMIGVNGVNTSRSNRTNGSLIADP